MNTYYVIRFFRPAGFSLECLATAFMHNPGHLDGEKPSALFSHRREPQRVA